MSADDFEPVDSQFGEPAVRAMGLRKVFHSNGVEKVAVSELWLDVYEGQVTALLGHNGAGKSTTFNMLTGLMRPDSGDAFIYGESVTHSLSAVRRILGVCPQVAPARAGAEGAGQHDVLWDQLSVMEHLQLFAALKGVPDELIDQYCIQTIAAIGLTEKTEQYSCTLSGGQKRKLSIGIATIGDSKVLYLDEPTSGMDPYSRRSTWEVIKAHKPAHVILFTTHFMDEADLLGDRVAIMSEGRLRCCGSAMFLKNRFGLGFKLTLSKRVGSAADDSPLRSAVAEAAPGSQLQSDQGAELSYQIPKGADFPKLFNALDAIKGNTDLDSWGISMTTLEEVFLQLAKSDKALSASTVTEMQALSASAELTGERGEDEVSFVLQFWGVFWKRFYTAMRDWFNIMIQIMVPLIFIFFACLAIKYGNSNVSETINLDAGQYNSPLSVPYTCTTSATTATTVTATSSNCPATYGSGIAGLGGSTGTTTYGTDVAAQPETAQFSCASYSDENKQAYSWGENAARPSLGEMSSRGKYEKPSASRANPVDYSEEIVAWLTASCATGIETSCNDAAVPSMYKCNGDAAGTSQVSQMGNYLYENRGSSGFDSIKQSKYGAISFNYDSTLAASNYKAASYPYVAYSNGSAYNGPLTYANFANNLILRESAVSSTAEIKTSLVPGPETSAERGERKQRTVIVLAFFLIIAFSIVPSSYVYNIVFEVRVKAKHQQMISGLRPSAYWFGMYTFDLLFYMIPMWLSIGLICVFENDQFYKDEQFGAILALFALYGIASIPQTYMFSFAFNTENNALLACISIYAFTGFVLFLASWILDFVSDDTREANNDILKYFFYLVPQFAFSRGIYNMQSYYYNKRFDAVVCKCSYSSVWDFGVAGLPLLYLSCCAVFFMAMVMLLQRGTTSMDGLLSKLCHSSPTVPEDQPYERDSDVQQEMDYLDSTELDPIQNPIIVRHLRKVFPARGNTGAKVAVKDVSFHVPVGHVFAYLGINGAGKTTSIAMMAGEFPPTSGDGTLAGLDMKSQREEINRLMGYCPQFDALFPKLTGREHLQLYARIKGISKDKEDAVVENMVKLMDLVKHAEREAGGYSGGNKRKLSVAIALLGGPKIVFLDEPSTGMDPEARRFMWTVISGTMTGRSVILTTHSMEEAEALSHQIGIMVGGRLRCLGTNQHLKAKFGRGYSLEVRVPSGQTAPLKVTSALRLQLVSPVLQAWITEQFAGGVLKEDLGLQLRYEIPQEGLQLSEAWQILEDHKHQNSVTEYAVSQTTLEQVFVQFAAEQEEETGVDADTLAAMLIPNPPPNYCSLCCAFWCSCQGRELQKVYQWSVPVAGGKQARSSWFAPSDEQKIQVKVEFQLGFWDMLCCCCKPNPGVVTVDGQQVAAVSESGYQTPGYPLLIEGDNNPGCGLSGCCGCGEGGCCSSCQKSSSVFIHSGKVFQIIDFNEIPGTQMPRPCYLFVDGKEVDSGLPRNTYMATLFQKIGKKYCCACALPLFFLFILSAIGGMYTILFTILLLVVFIYALIKCVICNWCGRAGHYREEPELQILVHEPNTTPIAQASLVMGTVQQPVTTELMPIGIQYNADSKVDDSGI